MKDNPRPRSRRGGTCFWLSRGDTAQVSLAAAFGGIQGAVLDPIERRLAPELGGVTGGAVLRTMTRLEKYSIALHFFGQGQNVGGDTVWLLAVSADTECQLGYLPDGLGIEAARPSRSSK
jgi:hypothetical protein